MKRAIWKFPLTPNDRIDIVMPVGAEILCVQTQQERPYLWAVVDVEARNETRSFTLLGTGHTFANHPGTYIGTFQLEDGNLVFHLFEK